MPKSVSKAKQSINEFGVANTVTMVRIFFIPVFLIILLVDWPSLFGDAAYLYTVRPFAAAFVFAVLAATDGVDGYLARSRNEVSTFGKFVDPLADKLLVTAALLALIEVDLLPAWIALVIISREFVVSGLRMIASAEGIVIAASWYGKIKTVLQIVAITMFIVMNSRLLEDLGHTTALLFQSTAWLLMGAAVIMTLMSMVDYFRNASQVIEGPWNRKKRED